ncbi:MAG: hypothetical protein KDH94_02480 [Coxiellaceae bacterium]|nr:hypothetical protein [Coxiellaceae bacterium]
MTKRIKHGGQLIHQSVRLIRQQKKLILLPLCSSILIILLMAFLYVPLTHYEKKQVLEHATASTVVWAYVALLLFLFVIHQIAIHFTAALTHCAKQYFKNKPICITEGIKAANSHFIQLYNWNSYAGTIGIFFNIFQKALKNLKFYQRMFQGLSWIIGTHLVIPVIMNDKSGPVNSIKTSSELIRKTWGTNLKANFGFLPLLVLARFLTLIPLIVGAIKGGHLNILVGTGTTVALIVLVSTISAATRSILNCALHIYASEGTVVPAYSEELIRKAFIPKTD